MHSDHIAVGQLLLASLIGAGLAIAMMLTLETDDKGDRPAARPTAHQIGPHAHRQWTWGPTLPGAATLFRVVDGGL